MSRAWWGWVCAAALLAAVPAAAAPAGTTPDSTAEYFTSGPSWLARWNLALYGDVRVRDDRLHDRPVPGGRASDSRDRLTLRAGLAWQAPAMPLQLEAGLRASGGKDDDRDPWAAFDNEARDTVQVDRLLVRWTGSGGGLAVGRMPMPLRLTDMLWDADLRPLGVSVEARPTGSDPVSVSVRGGAFVRSRWDAHDAAVVAGQILVDVGAGEARGADATVSFLGFLNRNEILRQGLTRQNSVSTDLPIQTAAFNVLDLQLGGRADVGRLPVELRLDGALNLDGFPSEPGRAFRSRLTLGGAGMPLDAQIGWVYERIERDALPGAFNRDDWWFHSRSNGNSAFAQIGAGPATLRIAGFDEHRDDLAFHTRRVVSELRVRWGH